MAGYIKEGLKLLGFLFAETFALGRFAVIAALLEFDHEAVFLAGFLELSHGFLEAVWI